MAQLKDLIVNGPSRFIGDVYATTFTGNLAGNANTATNATNAGMIAGLSVHSGRNNEANKIVRTDQNGYLQVGYINSSSGHEKNASNPTYVWGSNSSDSYLRSYQTSSLSVNYATSSGSCSGNAATATKAGYLDTGTMTLYANGGNEINFGGTNTSSTIYFGYRATGSKPVPTSFIFGGSGTATLTAGGFKKKDSSASYVLTGDGGHAAISSLSVNYANSSGSCSGNAATATNADTLDGYHASNLVKFYLSPMSGGAPADSATSWFENTMPAGTGAIVYNVPGSEKTIIAGKSTGAYGHMLQLNYDDNYLRILRYYQGSWKTTDWEKVSAGYADAAATATNADKLDGYHKNDILRKTYNPTSTISLNSVVAQGIDFTSWGYAQSANINNQPLGDGASSAACVVSFGTAYPFQIYSDYINTSYLYYRSYYAGTGVWQAWRQFAFLDSNVASASKWATPRTITLTGSVTGSVSIDGSANVSLATTTNHTHSYAGSSSAGGSANSALALLYTNNFNTNYGDCAVFQQNYNISDFPHGGWFNSIKMLHNNSTGYFTEIATSFTGEEGMWRRALRGGTQVGWYKILDSGNYNSYAPKLDGTGATGTWGINISGNAATATKLATARTIWGHNFDGTGDVSGALSGVTNINSALYINSSGNVTIGGSDLAGTSVKLYVDGTMVISNNKSILGKDISNNLRQLLVLDNGNDFVLGYGTSNAGFNTYIDGSEIYLRYGVSHIKGFILNSSGNVGIGTASPSYKLYVDGDGYFVDNVITEGDFSSRGDAIIDGHAKVNSLKASNICIECDNSGNSAGHTSEINNYSRPLYIQYSTSNNCCICYGGGNVGIGITSPTYKLHVYGDARIDGTISCIKLSQTSDIKYKTNIKQIEYEEALKIIENLNPVTWDWNENTVETGSSSGFVAQEAKEFIPNAISRDNENNLSLDYTQLHSYEIKVIQEQQKEIIKLKEKLKILEKLIS